jgi:hypothetical protein
MRQYIKMLFFLATSKAGEKNIRKWGLFRTCVIFWAQCFVTFYGYIL